MTFEPDRALPQDEVNDRVDRAIDEHEVVLFMKGNRLMPQCGFSAKALDLLSRHREDVATVDVLESLPEFRAALDRHSGWETIPQVYVEGEFVGGSDVLATLEERDELAATLRAE